MWCTYFKLLPHRLSFSLSLSGKRVVCLLDDFLVEGEPFNLAVD